MNEEADNLREKIVATFIERPYPGDDHLALPGGGCGGDRDDVTRFFRGKDWREIRTNSILSGDLDPNAFLYFMSTDAFLYYLPAFLIESLDVDSVLDLGESLAFGLTPPLGDPGDPGFIAKEKYFYPIVSALTQDEKQVVADVLQYLVREFDKRNHKLSMAREALDTYWAEPLGVR